MPFGHFLSSSVGEVRKKERELKQMLLVKYFLSFLFCNSIWNLIWNENGIKSFFFVVTASIEVGCCFIR